MPANTHAAPAPAPTPLELWGGVECTINRVGDRYFRQLDRSGHLTRAADLDLFARLGMRAARYPVLWEQHAPDGEDARGAVDWAWADERLGRLRALGVRPVVGLTHHGSGPRHTSLADPGFAPGLARYAALVAERFPWVEEWTPVNEPLTTARFSGLYGVWYPHTRDPRVFARALVHQCRAVQLSMRAIRQVNPAAKLVQTEDLGRVFSTPALDYEAEVQNERRWLSFDLLFGRVDRAHPMWRRLVGWGVREGELDAFLAEPCPPDVVGINHYLTSDRYLDERGDRYPAHLMRDAHDDGRRARIPYADVEAVRACPEAEIGAGPRLREAWERYGAPVAVTECHLGCTREEQLRWLLETWRAADALRAGGADVRGVTVWSLLGAFDWNSLVTCDAGHYEPGAFDVRGCEPGRRAAPRPTALAALARQLARGEEPDHPVLEHPGWWRRPDRLIYPAAEGRSYAAPAGKGTDMHDRSPRPLVVTGVSGTLGSAFARLCDVRGIPYHALSRRDLDVTDPAAVDAACRALRPWAVVNCAGWVRVDDAEQDEAACLRANADAPAALAAACARHGARLVAFSSDLVFDGVRRLGPYVESDAVAPLNAYGRSKAEMEARVLDLNPEALVVRTSAFFGPWDDHNFVTVALRELAAGRPFEAASDAVVSPTYVVDLVHATLDLLVDGERGVWHLANRGALTWADLARRAAEMAGVSAATLETRPQRAQGLPARRPRYSVLGSERASLLPTLDDALARYVRHRALAAPALVGARARRGGFRPWRYQQAQGWA